MSFEIVTKAIEEHGAAVAAIAKKTDEALDRLDRMEEKGVRLRGATRSPDAKNPIQMFMKSQGFQGMRDGSQSTGRVELPEISIKALVNVGRGQDGDSQFDVAPNRDSTMRNDPRLALQLLVALPSIPVTSSTYEFTQLASFTNNADFQVTEGTLKAESGMSFQQVTANIDTIAHWTRASVQILDDAPTLGTYVSNLLGYGLLTKLESSLINGTGGTGRINGLRAQATAFPTAGSPYSTAAPIDRIGAAVASQKAAGWKPGIILMNPMDWFSITDTKATDGQYLIGNPQSPAPATLWGCRVIESASMPAGEVLIIDTANVAILERMQPTIIATRFDRDNLVTNLVTILAELRAGLAVFAQDALLSVSIVEA